MARGAAPGRLRRALRAAVFVAGAPALLLAALADRLLARVAGPAGLANAYRLLARKDVDAPSRPPVRPGDGAAGLD